MRTKNFFRCPHPSPLPACGEGKNLLPRKRGSACGWRSQRGEGHRVFFLMALALTLSIASCAQEDKETLFSDTEIAIIKTLLYQDPPDDPTSNYDQNEAAATLGQKFFWDPRFSGETLATGSRSTVLVPINTAGKISCATCHNPNFGWADGHTRPNEVSLGANFTTRNTPTVLNVAFNTYSLWDGSADSPWALNRAPIEGGPHNFGRLALAEVICTNYATAAADDYDAVFDDGNLTTGAFTTAICTAINGSFPGACTTTAGSVQYGKPGHTCYDGNANKTAIDRIFANFMKAIAAYERKLVSKNSPFDRWVNGDENAMSVSQKRGLKLFIGKGNCVRCHNGPNFSDGKFHNLGVPQTGGFTSGTDTGRTGGITKLLNTATDSTSDNGYFNTASSFNDGSVNRVAGLAALSSDLGAFKTPTLRSVNLTPPFFHNGTFASLWDVINFYNFAGNAGNFPGTKDSILTTRRMTNEEMEDLVTFLKALEGETLASSLTTRPVGITAPCPATTTPECSY
jgi:cytochrome c peroxidase